MFSLDILAYVIQICMQYIILFIMKFKKNNLKCYLNPNGTLTKIYKYPNGTEVFNSET